MFRIKGYGEQIAMFHGGNIYDKKVEYDFSVNLNPLPCPETVGTAMANGLKLVRNYPDYYKRRVCSAVADSLQIRDGEHIKPVSCEQVLCGNGASEIIYGICSKVRPVKAFIYEPCFDGYRYALNAAGCENIEFAKAPLIDCVELATRKKIPTDFEAFAPDIIIVGNPNNPTGRLLGKNELTELLNNARNSGAVVIVDESFIEMSVTLDGTDVNELSAINYINDYDNLYVVRSYTKLFSIPGVRFGYCISGKGNIEALSRYLPEWSVSVIAEEAAVECANIIKNTDFPKKTRRLIADERAWLISELQNLGFEVKPSDTSFVLIKSENDIYSDLLDKNILVRKCDSYRFLGSEYVRIAVKGHDENQILIKALGDIVEKHLQ